MPTGRRFSPQKEKNPRHPVPVPHAPSANNIVMHRISIILIEIIFFIIFFPPAFHNLFLNKLKLNLIRIYYHIFLSYSNNIYIFRLILYPSGSAELFHIQTSDNLSCPAQILLKMSSGNSIKRVGRTGVLTVCSFYDRMFVIYDMLL